MKFVNHRSIYSIIFFLLVIILIIVARPSLMFHEDGQVKQFGIGDDKTIISMGSIVCFLSIFTYYVFLIIDILFKS